MKRKVTETFHRAALCHKKLGNPIRYLIYRLVGEKQEVTSRQLATMIDRGQANVAQHLKELKEEDMVRSRRDGSDVLYKIKRRDIYRATIEFEKLFAR